MAITPLGTNGLVASGIEKNNDNSWVITFTADTQAGDILLLAIAVDNLTGSTPTISSVVDSSGNTWSNLNGFLAPSSGAATSVKMQTHYCIVPTTGHAIGDTLTVTLSGAVTAKTGIVIGVRGAASPFPNNNINGTTSNPSLATSVSPVVGGVVIGFLGFEDNAQPTGDSDTLNGSWTPLVGVNTTGGSGATNVGVCSQMKVVNATGNQTWNITQSATDWAMVLYRIGPAASIETEHFVFKFNDGDEDEASNMVAVDVAPTQLLPESPIRIRFGLKETSNVSRADTWSLQARVNGGAWGTSAFSMLDSGFVVNNALTTQQITSGTFVGGRFVDTSASTSSITLTGLAHTEVEFCIKLLETEVGDGDVVDFRVINGSGQPTESSTVTPSGTVDIPSSASLVKYWDGSAWVSKPLKRWDGAAWVDATLKRWDGSAWQPV